MIAAVLHVLAIGALGVFVRRRFVGAPAAWRWVAGLASVLAAAIAISPTQARVAEASASHEAWPALLAAAGPAGDLVLAVMLNAALVLVLPGLFRARAGRRAAAASATA